jgi:hypothetical protein
MRAETGLRYAKTNMFNTFAYNHKPKYDKIITENTVVDEAYLSIDPSTYSIVI